MIVFNNNPWLGSCVLKYSRAQLRAYMTTEDTLIMVRQDLGFEEMMTFISERDAVSPQEVVGQVQTCCRTSDTVSSRRLKVAMVALGRALNSAKSHHQPSRGKNGGRPLPLSY